MNYIPYSIAVIWSSILQFVLKNKMSTLIMEVVRRCAEFMPDLKPTFVHLRSDPEFLCRIIKGSVDGAAIPSFWSF